MNQRLNVKFLAGLVAATLLIGGSVHWLHAYQVRRNAHVLLDQANRARAQGKLDQAAKHFDRYLSLAPGDGAARADLAQTLDQLAPPGTNRLHVFLAYEQALRLAPERHDLRRRQVQIAQDEGRLVDALAHLQVLLQAAPNDGELRFQTGACQEASGQYAAAAASFAAAIQQLPIKTESYTRLAGLLRRRLDQPEQADKVMADLVAANGQSFAAYLARAKYRKEFGPAAEADGDVARALELAPEQAEVLLTAAEFAQAAGAVDQARAHLQRGCQRHPQNGAMYLALAALEARAGRRAAALACVRRGLEAVPGLLDLHLTLADLLIQTGAGTEAREVLARLRQQGGPAAALDYLEACQLMQQGRWGPASRLLEQARPALASEPAIGTRAELALVQCYEHLGDADRQLAAARRAVGLEPGGAAARAGLAHALTAAGRLDEAVAEYRQLLTLADAPPASGNALARLLVLRNLRRPPAERDWQEVERILRAAEQATPDRVAVALWRAEALAAQGQLDRARDTLCQACSAHPEHVGPWLALADLAQRQKDYAAASSCLDEAERLLGDSIELRLARAVHWTARGGSGAAKGLASLEQNPEPLPPQEQTRLLRGLAEAYQRLGLLKEAERMLRQVAEREPEDLRARLLWFQLAFTAGNHETLQTLQKDIERIEGGQGPFWHQAAAMRLLLLAQGGDQQALAGVRQHLAAVAEQRPNWSAAAVCEAQLEELAGNPDRAIDSYRRAVDLGDVPSSAVRRLVQLLFERRRYHEADQALRRVQEQQRLTGRPGGLQRLAAEVSLRVNDADRALDLARQAVVAHAGDFRDYVWLGQLLAAGGQSAEAEAALRQAVVLADKSPEAWVALVQHLARTGQNEVAVAALAEAKSKLPAEHAPLALAHCYEAVGRWEAAAEQYRTALAEKGNDGPALRSAAGFYLRTGQPHQAEPLLRQLVAKPARTSGDVVAWARRNLAVLGAARGSEPQIREALQLLGQNLAASGANVDDQRAKARVLSMHAGRGARHEAIRLLEELRERQAAAADDQFLLAQLYEADRQWPKARATLRNLVAAQDQAPAYLAHYTRGLLRRGAADEARPWVEKLQQVEPRGFRALEARARLLAAEGRAAAAVEALEQSAQEITDHPAARLGPVAVLLDELGQTAAAERAYRDLVRQRPDNVLVLVTFLGRQGRTAEALDWCAGAWASRPAPAVARACINVLRAKPAAAAECQRVETWLADALRREPDAPALLMCLADLRDLQGRLGEAEAIYRQVLARDPRHFKAMNNLAWLLAGKDRTAAGEALTLIQQAVDIAGPHAELLDTRAVVYLALGRNAEALADLDEAVAEMPTPSKHFHQARAYLLARNRAAAAETWQRAKKAGLEFSKLHVLDRRHYERVAGQCER